MTKPANVAHVTCQVGDDQVVGAGMPMIVSFGVEIPKERRAEVQRRLFMSSDPPQEGVWSRFSAQELHYGVAPSEAPFWLAGGDLVA